MFVYFKSGPTEYRLYFLSGMKSNMSIIFQIGKPINKFCFVLLIRNRVGNDTKPILLHNTGDLFGRQSRVWKMMKRITTYYPKKVAVIKWQLHSLISDEVQVMILFNVRFLIVELNCCGNNIYSSDKNVMAVISQFKSDVAISRPQIQIVFTFDKLAKVQESGQMLFV